MKTIGILTANDSERHLSNPIFKELKSIGLEVYFIKLTENNIIDAYHSANYSFTEYHYDFILAVADRPEQIGGVLAAFQNKIPIGHLYAGDYNTIATFDDKHRHAITLYSDIQFCSCKESTENTVMLMRSAGLVPDANCVGATHFNYTKINKYDTIKLLRPYILILINSETIGNDNILIEETIVECLLAWTPGTNIIIAKGNEDNISLQSEIFNKIRSQFPEKDVIIRKETRKEHEYFISLINQSDYFISNSSSVIYEAPVLLERERIIHIGNRNKGRTKIPMSSHDGLASTRIADLIKVFLESRK